MRNGSRPVVVVGDPAVIGVYQEGYKLGEVDPSAKGPGVRYKSRPPEYDEVPEQVQFWRMPWGAALVHQLIEFASASSDDKYVWSILPIAKLIDDARKIQNPEFVVQAAARWQNHWDGRWRVRQASGRTRRPVIRFQERHDEQDGFDKAIGELSGIDDAVLVIDDLGHGWAEHDDIKPNLEELIRLSSTIVVKIEDLIKQGGPTPTPTPLITLLHKGRSEQKQVVIHMHIRALRAAGGNIGASLSWERTGWEVAQALFSSSSVLPELSELLEANAGNAVIISTGHAGSIILQHQKQEATDQDAKDANLQLVIDPEALELDPESRYAGQSFGTGRYVLASLAALAARTPGILTEEHISHAVRSGLHVGRAIFEDGYGDSRVRLGLVKRLEVSKCRKGLLDTKNDDEAAEPGCQDDGSTWRYHVIRSTLPVRPTGWRNPERVWQIFKDVWNDKKWSAEQPTRLYELVRTGKLHDSLPRLSVGDWISYDRDEIEEARAVLEAMRVYLGQPGERKAPLGILVFGRPGSGKSFFVEQTIEMLNRQFRGRSGVPELSKLEVNLSQLASEDDLLPSLDKIRDEVARGKVPVVLWDEFDCTVSLEPFYWLKRFLDPLQRGKYRRGEHGEEEGELGKAIFVFAGGIHATIDEFHKRVAGDDPTQGRKLRDFASRIRVAMDVPGTAPDAPKGRTRANNWAQFLWMVRRALLLRGAIIRWWPNVVTTEGDTKIVHVSPQVVEFLTECEQYVYNARSLEMIVRSSALSGATEFQRAALPPDAILRLHMIGHA